MEYKREQADWLVAVLQSREQESARISRLLHDEVGQILSAAGLQLDLLRMDCSELEGFPERILSAQKLLEQAVAQVRDISYALNPSIVERAGLQFALDRLIGRHRKSFTGALRLMFDGSVHIPMPAAKAFYSISEEAIENAVEHSRCSNIEVLFRKKGDAGVLEIRDNGCGFDMVQAVKQSRGLGIRLMNYHASKAGIELSIASASEKGTIVRAICRVVKRTGDLDLASMDADCSPAASG